MATKSMSQLVAALLCTAGALRKGGSSSGKQEEVDCYSVYDGRPLLQFSPSSKEDLWNFTERLVELGCTELGDDGSKKMLAICSRPQVEVVAAQYHHQVRVLDEDAGAFYRKSSGTAKPFAELQGATSGALSAEFYADWRDYDARVSRVEAVVAASGGVASLEELGRTAEGRPLLAVRLRGPGWVAGGPRVVANFQLHAREWIAGMAGVYAVEQAVAQAKADPSWLAGMELALVPLSNPDGDVFSETRERMWRKNRRANAGCPGVDLNRNWDPDWAGRESTSRDPCNDMYCGPSAFSEPETQAVKNLLDEAPVSIHLDVHAFSELILAPWSYTLRTHPRRAEIDVPGKLMRDAVKATHGKIYQYGAAEVLYPASGVAPDYSTLKGAFGFTYELRPSDQLAGGFAPNRNQILPTAEECMAGLLAAISWAKDPYTTPKPAPTQAPAECPWYCSAFGCASDGCEVCPQCS